MDPLHGDVFLRFLAIKMALVLRRSTHGKLDIQGYSVTEWKRRKERKKEARHHLNHAFTSGGGGVAYSAGSGGSGAGAAGSGGDLVEIHSS